MELHSTDTAGSLLVLPSRDLYGRLALWLVDAGEEEISSFLQSYRVQGGCDHEILRLLFVNWTRIDPQPAIQAAANDEDLYEIWFAWAIHDPQAALAASAAAGGNTVFAVCSAIGKFHPAWLLAHFDRLPDDDRVRGAAISALGRRDPPFRVTARTLQLAEKWRSPELTSQLLSMLADSDPFQGWLLIHDKNSSNHQSGYDALEMFMDQVKASQFRELERISDTLPPGESKRRIDCKAMELLARVNPETALAKARSHEVSRIKVQLMAIAGKAFIHHDPKRALQIADELFTASPDGFNPPKIELPDGTSDPSQGENLFEVDRFLSGLGRRDPQALMETFLARDPNLLAAGTLASLAEIWAGQAPESYAMWLNAQTDPFIRESGARALVNRLTRQEQYPEALDWAVSLAESPDNLTDKVFRKWRNFNPAAALEWLDSANMPDDRKEKLREGSER